MLKDMEVKSDLKSEKVAYCNFISSLIVILQP